MKHIIYPFVLIIIFLSYSASAQTTDVLKEKLGRIITGKQAVVGLAICGNDGRDTLSLNGEMHVPMQSVFKYHIAIALLSQIDKGKFSFDQAVEIKKKELLPDLYSPLRDKYPEGVTLPLTELIEYAVSLSDNIACDILLRLMGGPQAVENFFIENGFDNISIKLNEEMMQSDWDAQFQNWTTPKAANEVLKVFYDNSDKQLSEESHNLIWNIMRETTTGANRLKGKLPEGAVVAHKTGTSGIHQTSGIRAAVNDVGIVFLPNGQYYVISVFVTNSKENADTNESIIAEISKAAWDYFTLLQK